MAIDPNLREEAVHWAIRTRDPKFEDWDMFMAWLDEDRSRAVAYDEVADFAHDFVRLVRSHNSAASPAAANDNPSPLRRFRKSSRRQWLGGAIAAASLAIIAAVALLQVS